MSAAELKNIPTPVVPEIPADARFTEVKSDLVDKLQNEFIFHFEFTSPVDDKLYAGTFRARRLTLGAFGQMRVVEARLNGGVEPTGEARVIHNMMAYCRAVLHEVPEWWAPESFYDFDILRLVHDHVRHWENSFRRPGMAR